MSEAAQDVKAGPSSAPSAAEQEAEARKRHDIIDGARRVFFHKGFDGASMDEIARAAAVSKATIYVYFESKADLFRALVEADKRQSAERLLDLDENEDDVAVLLHRVGMSFMNMMVRPDHIRLVRMVIGVAEKFPAVGQAFFQAGPCQGGRLLADLLGRQAALGRLRVDDGEAAAYDFFNLCQGNLTKALMFGRSDPPSPQAIEAQVARAVRIFLCAYGAKDQA